MPSEQSSFYRAAQRDHGQKIQVRLLLGWLKSDDLINRMQDGKSCIALTQVGKLEGHLIDYRISGR